MTRHCQELRVPNDVKLSGLGPAHRCGSYFNVWSLNGDAETNGHASCVHNEYVGLMKRHLLPEEKLTDEGRQAFKRGLKYLHWCSRGQLAGRMTIDEVVDSYVGPKRLAYAAAAVRLKRDGLLRKHFVLKSFVKVQKTTDPVGTDPRIIQARSMEFNLEIAQYLKPVEHIIYGLMSIPRLTGEPHPTVMSAKGHNLWRRAEEIAMRMGIFGEDTVCLMLDGSRFDGHVNKMQQDGVHGLYSKLSKSRKFMRLLKRTLSSKGVTSGGYIYDLGARRASGDCDTACGNTTIMNSCLTGILLQLNVSKFSLYADGDDALIFTVKSEVAKVRDNLPRMINGIGHVVRYVFVANTIDEVVFCRSKVVKLAAGYKMCRDYELVLDTALTSHKHFGGPEAARMLRAYAQGYAAVHSGEPVLGPIFSALAAHMGSGPVGYDKDLEWKKYNSPAKLSTVGTAERVSYEQAWGLTPVEQIHLENRCIAELTGVDWQAVLPIR